MLIVFYFRLEGYEYLNLLDKILELLNVIFLYGVVLNKLVQVTNI
ncbi:hypothetical protein H1P_4070005 [Hyella patelloides LEGE 07179]|uniref:Uncharacterized protein n=1 Tax=Hyella patelloides LEGE 07179 TaxID=945734 RepID=A0A563VXE3_9CYAN|nr:hypothetical protein H1P_4070005 [Hyella patelloides LEGE 07179]